MGLPIWKSQVILVLLSNQSDYMNHTETKRSHNLCLLFKKYVLWRGFEDDESLCCSSGKSRCMREVRSLCVIEREKKEKIETTCTNQALEDGVLLL
jgi:hypothetical protein